MKRFLALFADFRCHDCGHWDSDHTYHGCTKCGCRCSRV